MIRSIPQILTSTIDPKKIPVDNLIQVFEMNTLKDPDKVIFYYLEDGYNETSRITYGEMNHRVKAIAGLLQSEFSKGERALMLFPPGIEFIINLFGCFYSGIIGVPAYPPRKNRLFERFEAIVRNCDPSLVLTTQRIYDDLQKNFAEEECLRGMKYVVYENISDDHVTAWRDPLVDPNDVAILQYTSGSTGSPNGVMVSHKNIIFNSEFIKQAFGHSNQSIGVNWLPGFHDMGLVGALIQPAYVGCTNVIIPPNSFLLRPMNWLKSISKFRGTTAGGPNFALDFCVDRIKEEELEGVDLSSVRPFFCGAEPIRKETLDRFSKTFGKWNFKAEQLYPCYGMAESVLIITGGGLDEKPVCLTVDGKEIEKGVVREMSGSISGTQTYVSCGYPWAGTTVVIVDPGSKKISAPGRIGEIWTSGPSVAMGYWNNPEETREVFQAFLGDTGEGPFLRTGDLGFIHEGHLYITGRIKDLIIIRGMNHYPQDIEHTVENCHEALATGACAAFSVEEGREERLVLVNEIRRTHLRDLNSQEVIDAIKEAVAERHQLQVFAVTLLRTGAIPKTSSGKIQRYACRRDFLAGQLEEIASWKLQLDDDKKSILSETEIHDWIRNWMAKELKIDPRSIAIDQPITKYGLDSLKAVVLARDASDHLDAEIPLDIFLEDTTIENITIKVKEFIG